MRQILIIFSIGMIAFTGMLVMPSTEISDNVQSCGASSAYFEGNVVIYMLINIRSTLAGPHKKTLCHKTCQTRLV